MGDKRVVRVETERLPDQAGDRYIEGGRIYVCGDPGGTIRDVVVRILPDDEPVPQPDGPPYLPPADVLVSMMEDVAGTLKIMTKAMVMIGANCEMNDDRNHFKRKDFLAMLAGLGE